MTDRAYVTQDWPGRNVAVHLAVESGEDRFAIGLPTAITFEEQPEGHVTAYTEPTLRIPESMARALLDALAAHFGGTAEAQTLRKDYMAERARVDKMIDYLTAPTPSLIYPRSGSTLATG